jgi:ribosomal protein S18 acetylase RimI-like enzyme
MKPETGNQGIGLELQNISLSPWRGKNSARHLITAGLQHLKQHGLDEAHLEVRAQNENALRLYFLLGFEVLRESRFYVLRL